jgi:membrane-associated protease RseP (regulator of RpoE activity)
MSDDERSPLQRAASEIETAIGHLFTVHDVTLGIRNQPDAIRLRGRLNAPSHRAYPEMAKRIRKIGYTVELRHDPESDLDVLLAVPGVIPQKSDSRIWVNVVLFVLTVLSTLFVGASWSDKVPAGADEIWLLTHLWLGWPFALSLMTILTGHELGHYIAGRHYKLPVSLPYFVPFPVPPLGTMGAVILMKGRSLNRRQMLTVGAAGPLIGFVLAVPILILGLSLSTVEPMSMPEPGGVAFLEGNSLLYLLLKFAVFGKILPGSGLLTTFPAAAKEMVAALFGTVPLTGGYDVMIHPVALAGWAGLLVTALNLLPVGQLDGGHVMYSLLGHRARIFTWPIVILLVIMGFFLWPGWFLWAGLIFLFGRQHPDPLDDVTRLGPVQKIYAALVLAIFLLVFTPVPLQLITGEPLVPEIGQAANCLGLPALVLGIALWFVRKRRDHLKGENPSRPQSHQR